jgi:hypothetical protein
VPDILTLARDITMLIREREIETAFDRLRDAQDKHRQTSFVARRRTIHQINSRILQIKKQKEKIRETIRSLPERERLFAEQKVGDVIETLFLDELNELRKEKRNLARSS